MRRVGMVGAGATPSCMLMVCGYASCAALRAPPPAMQQRQQATPAVTEAVTGGSALLTATDLSLSYNGERFLFRGISFSLAQGCKLALVGENGAGKSSLLKVLRGIEAPETGSVDVARNVRMTYIDQDPTLPEGCTADEFIFRSDAPAVAALVEYRAAVAAAEALEAAEVAEATGMSGAKAADVSDQLGRAAAAMDQTDAWGIEEEMHRLCDTLDVAHLLKRDAATLSGGERKRVALAAALLSQPDVLLLDEPTNHLDISAIRFLEDELAAASLSALIVTHDRSFLSATCSEVLELSRSKVT